MLKIHFNFREKFHLSLIIFYILSNKESLSRSKNKYFSQKIISVFSIDKFIIYLIINFNYSYIFFYFILIIIVILLLIIL